ncbi:hypothetical protein D3C73_695470 [compost metagenome]
MIAIVPLNLPRVTASSVSRTLIPSGSMSDVTLTTRVPLLLRSVSNTSTAIASPLDALLLSKVSVPLTWSFRVTDSVKEETKPEASRWSL